MKYAKLMKYWQEKPTLMGALVRKHYLLSQGFVYVGDSSLQQTSADFNKEVMIKLQKAEEVVSIPVFNSGLSGYLGWQEAVVEGQYKFFARFPEDEEEAVPDTLPGGFRVERQLDLFENPASPYRTIKRRLPSELLYELSFERLCILHEQVERWYFEPDRELNKKEHKRAHQNKRVKCELTVEDIITLSKMENNQELNAAQLLRKDAAPEDRSAGKRLNDYLCKTPLVVRVYRNPIYTLSVDALNGGYAAVVHKKYLPREFQ